MPLIANIDAYSSIRSVSPSMVQYETRSARTDVAAAMTIDAAKKELRSRMIAVRDAMSAEDRAVKSRHIAAHAIEAWTSGVFAWSASPGGERPLRLAAYAAFRSEADATDVARWCWANDVPVAMPRVDAAAKTMTLHGIAGEHELRPGAYGIPEPAPDAPPAPLAPGTLVLVPGLAFDAAGRRLGYGGGYYDRMLAAHRAEAESGAIVLAAFAFARQLVETVPAAPHDMRVHYVVTEDGVIDCRRKMA